MLTSWREDELESKNSKREVSDGHSRPVEREVGTSQDTGGKRASQGHSRPIVRKGTSQVIGKKGAERARSTHKLESG